MCIVALIKIQFPRASTCGWQILCMFRKTDLLYFVVVCRFKKIVSLIFYEKYSLILDCEQGLFW